MWAWHCWRYATPCGFLRNDKIPPLGHIPVENRGEMCYNCTIPTGKDDLAMKRVVAVLLAAALCFGCAGCKVLDGVDYMKAMKQYEAGEYDSALAIFAELGNYADSQTMAALCKQFVDYAAAEQLYAAGNYREALPVYESLLLYEDSPVKAVLCRYALGEECAAAENYAEAVTWFESLGGYEGAPEKCRQARYLWLWQRLDQEGSVNIKLETGEKVTLSALKEQKIRITYRSEGSLLGMPYAYRVRFSFGYGEDPAKVTVKCESYAASTIEETASGKFDRAGFTGSSLIELTSFSQTITVESQEEDPVSQTEELAEAVLVHTVLSDAQRVAAENLTALLEQTGVAISLADLGFLSL